jgi:hypothetical protein
MARRVTADNSNRILLVAYQKMGKVIEISAGGIIMPI